MKFAKPSVAQKILVMLADLSEGGELIIKTTADRATGMTTLSVSTPDSREQLMVWSDGPYVGEIIAVIGPRFRAYVRERFLPGLERHWSEEAQ